MAAAPRLIDLSHGIVDGMITYRGLPAPRIGEHLTHEQSRKNYGPDTEFSFGKMELVSNTGTYLDSPYHRYRDREDVSQLPLERVANLPGLLVDAVGISSIGADHFAGLSLKGKAVLVRTGWDRRWRTEAYFTGHPFLTEAAAVRLRDEGAVLVGIDSLNIDSTQGGTRPVHSVLLEAGVLIVEHLCGLEQLVGEREFRFHAVPLAVAGMGSIPVRAYGVVG